MRMLRRAARSASSCNWAAARASSSIARGETFEQTSIIGASQFQRAGTGKPYTRRAERMAERNRSAVGVDARLVVPVDAEILERCDGLAGERLVQFDNLHVVHPEARARERLARRRNRPKTHLVRPHTGDGG